MKKDRILGLAFAGMLGSIATQSAQAQNLLQNGSFETGDFTDWTQSGSGGFEGVSTSFFTSAYDGTYSAFFGAVGDYNVVSQTIATTLNDNYNISFALYNSAGPINDMSVTWGGNTVFDISNVNAFGWTLFGFDVTGPVTGDTTISFNFRQDPGYFNFDAASVVDLNNRDYTPIENVNVPAPAPVPDTGAGTWATVATLLGVCALGYRRRLQAA